jgi:hypothetical protein
MQVRALGAGDAEWVERLVVERWGAPIVVGRGRVQRPAELPRFAAFEEGLPIGLVT